MHVDLIIFTLNEGSWFYSINGMIIFMYIYKTKLKYACVCVIYTCTYACTHIFLYFITEKLTFQPLPNILSGCLWYLMCAIINNLVTLGIRYGDKMLKTWNGKSSLQSYWAQHGEEFTGDYLFIIMARHVEVFSRRRLWAPLCSSFGEVWGRLVVILRLRCNSRKTSMAYIFLDRWT